MKLLVIMTGGTIGSSFDGESVNVNETASTPVIEQYQKEHTDISFEITAPLNILSESVEAEDLEMLWQALYDVDFDRYDGVIITCGSDTLAYLSSFVGLLFAHRPIALVCANKILTAEDSNGYENFSAAVGILRQGMREVFVPYRNSDGVMYIHLATELREADYKDDFQSLYTPYAIFDGGIRENTSPLCHDFPEGIFDEEHPLKLKEKVAVISPYPLLDYDTVDITSSKAVLHLSYHSGTLNADKAKRLMEKAGNKPVFLAPIKKNAKPYKTTSDMICAGMIPLFDISPECAYMKLTLAVNQQKMSVDKIMGC